MSGPAASPRRVRDAAVAAAKINLFLAVTGRRPDGYHDLVSVAAPLAWGDRLEAEPADEPSVLLECDDPAVPTGADNLVVKAAEAFRSAAGWRGGVRFRLAKSIPMGAGLGGGSSDATAALRLLNRLTPEPLAEDALAAVAASVGSDCPLFLAGGPVVMRGRGERIERLSAEAARRLSGRRLVVFKPGFGVATAWAYGRLAADPGAGYLPAEEAERRVATWIANPSAPAERLLFNGFEPAVFAKFPALPLVLERLRERLALEPRMSGSGSACFALLPEGGGPTAGLVAAEIRRAWGPGAWCVETTIG